ncbi:AAA family ATPase [candidate division KSB1 bacterium]|nr:AAA family ATPase [candidate division KSB1 bacterium]RQW06489.1 MAG: ATP-binding cassette domain-containing protein [candidate division KSB1 bacterium]
MHIKSIRLLHDRYPTCDFYPFNLEILQKTTAIELASPITFFIGENGAGKSTLLKAIANKSYIHIWDAPPVRRIKPNPYEQLLHQAINISWTDGRVPGSYFGSQIFNRFTYLLEEWAAADPGLIDYFGGHSLMTLSHGQSLVAFFKTRYKIKGLYLLDEPETALSPRSQLDLVRVLKDAAALEQAQFIIATHSPILLATPGAEIWSFDAAPIRPIPYRETDYYNFYRDFMNNMDCYLSPSELDPR